MTKLGMPRGYWQVPIASSDVGLTGFVTSQGHYYWRFMPFGLRNAPATFSRLVTEVFKGLEEFCEAYLDDIMVVSRYWEAHTSPLQKVFDRVRLANVKLNILKC